MAVDDHHVFADWLRRCRGMCGWTQAQFAAKLGYSVVTYRKVEQGGAVSPAFARRLADVLMICDSRRPSFLYFAQTSQHPHPHVFFPEVSFLTVLPALDQPPQLPIPAHRLIGRDDERARVRAQMLLPHIRLVTLVGPPGIGKTHLALDVAADLCQRFPDGICFIALAALNEPCLLLGAIGQALGLSEQGGPVSLARLQQVLTARKMLLILDTFEHLVAAAPLLGRLLVGAPRLTILVTSRSALRISEEVVLSVSPLALPTLHPLPLWSALPDYAAVALFVERARAVMPDLQVSQENAESIAEICVRLDGIPLALELAAARLRLFSVDELLERMSQRLCLLVSYARDLPLRQQTLRASIDWSYELLSANERRLFARLAVFAGGWSLTVAEAVCACVDGVAVNVVDGVEALLDQSMLQRVPGSAPRFMLLDTLREYALERLLASGERALVERRLAEYYLVVAQAAAADCCAAGQPRWADQLGQELDNVHAAMIWALQSDEVVLAQALTQALVRAGMQAWQQQHHIRARTLLEESLTLWHDLGDREQVSHVLSHLNILRIGERSA